MGVGIKFVRGWKIKKNNWWGTIIVTLEYITCFIYLSALVEFLWSIIRCQNHLVNTLVICSEYSLFLKSYQFSIHKFEVLLTYFRLKTPFYTYFERDLSTVKSLNYLNRDGCKDSKQMFEWDALQTVSLSILWITLFLHLSLKN